MATGSRGPKRSRSLPGRRHAETPQNARGSTSLEGFPLWHIRQPLATVRPAEEPGQSPRLWRTRQRAVTTPRDKEPWPIPSPQPHAASRGAACRLP